MSQVGTRQGQVRDEQEQQGLNITETSIEAGGARHTGGAEWSCWQTRGCFQLFLLSPWTMSVRVARRRLADVLSWLGHATGSRRWEGLAHIHLKRVQTSRSSFTHGQGAFVTALKLCPQCKQGTASNHSQNSQEW